ncbi:hypothetical protein BDV25DRAFT_37979 [Aspergillus avenaceus]|uniref:Protein-S-isoprenylcysteine O-methyltransferase n=1 Tax=Aspergillus avenaceus TaxID=36643 RepID=A0A5N6U943_ASPAV|nr:hypothetical protein BDV25DRAFT_37979 [Aspergillus avenaceus]
MDVQNPTWDPAPVSEPFSDGSSILYCALVIYASYLMTRMFTAPNPDPPHALEPDRLASPKCVVFLHLYQYLLGAVGVLHGLFGLLPRCHKQALCPSASWNSGRFVWSTSSSILLFACLLAAHLRLLAYRQLGKDFTFRLSRPSGLVRSGLYAYMQHPSYTGAIVTVACFTQLLVRSDGILGCWMGNYPWNLVMGGVIYANSAFLVGALLITLPARILKEETLLRECFGAEWDEYHRQTARLIPWVY